MHDPKIGRWWYPQCIGGIYGKHGCTCPRGVKAKQDKIDQLERRIAKLEEATVRADRVLGERIASDLANWEI